MTCELCRLSPTGECEFCRIRKEIYSAKKLNLPALNLYTSERHNREELQKRDYGSNYRDLTFKTKGTSYTDYGRSPSKKSESYQNAA